MFFQDVRAITGFRETPKPGSLFVDLGRVADAPRERALEYLVAMRTLGTAGQFAEFHATNDGSKLLSPLVSRMFAPVSPLLLISSISLSIARNEDHAAFLTQYVRGLEVTGLESLFKLDFIDDESELLRVLELEDEFLGAMMNWAAALIVEHGRVIEHAGDPTALDLYWVCWIIANQSFRKDPLPTRTNDYAPPGSGVLNGWLRGIRWGIENNTAIHAAREHYEHRLALANGRVNSALAAATTATDPSELQRALVGQQVATLMVERARRFYFWAPHEIDAFSVQNRIRVELEEAGYGSGEDPDPVAPGEADEPDFSLPPELLSRLKAKEETTHE